jgi:predicted MFS family arabinose efflux permease
MELPSLAQAAIVALAIALGVGFAFSLLTQMALQRRAMAGDPKASLFNRLTMAGLSMAILLAAVLTAKTLSNTVSKEAFMLTASFGALSTLFLRLRSNSTVKRDARKSGARPSP